MSGRVVAGEDSEEDTAPQSLPTYAQYGYGGGAQHGTFVVAGEDDEDDTAAPLSMMTPAYGYYHPYSNNEDENEEGARTSAAGQGPQQHAEANTELSSISMSIGTGLATPRKTLPFGLMKQAMRREQMTVEGMLRVVQAQLSGHDAALTNSNIPLTRSFAIAQDVNNNMKQIVQSLQGLTVVMNRVGTHRQRGWLGLVKTPPPETISAASANGRPIPATSSAQSHIPEKARGE